MAITEYGKLIREIRESLGKSLRQMAIAIGYSATYLSAVEMGDRPITADFMEKVIGFLRKHRVDTKGITKVCAAADRTRRSVDVSSLDAEGRAKVAAFARKLADTIPEDEQE